MSTKNRSFNVIRNEGQGNQDSLLLSLRTVHTYLQRAGCIALLLLVTGCACVAKETAPAAAGHALSGFDTWAVIDMAVGVMVEAGQCHKGV